MARRLPPAIAAGLAALLAWASCAQAHATLEGTAPPRGAVVKQEPETVVLSFSEPVEGNFGALRVYGAEGGRADEGDAFHPGGEEAKLGVHLEPGLPEGSYTATYRVVSADGHIVSGGYVFSIGKAGQAPAKTVAELVAGSSSGTVTRIGMGAARGVQYGALALALGALAFFLLAWLPALRRLSGGEPWERASAAFGRRLRAALLLAAVAGTLGAAAAIVCEAAQAAGTTFGAALDWTVLQKELGTRFGTVWALTMGAWILFGLGALAGLRRVTPARAVALLAPLAMAVLEPALSGHPSTQPPVALLFPANVLHVLAMAVWVGGLASILFVLPAATRELEPAQRSRLLAAVLTRFSPIALGCVAVIVFTGVGQAYAYVRHLDALFDTAYGRAVLIKLGLLLGGLIPLGAYHRYRSMPRLQGVAAGGEAPARAGLLVRRALRWEVALVVVVLGVTGALAGLPPATAVQSGPVSVSSELGPAEVEVTVDPARVGSNQVHLYLFDAKNGAQFGDLEELAVTASLPEKSIGPLPLQARHAGPGHYVVQGALLSVAGDWQIEVTMRVSAFDEYAAKLEAPIR